MRRTKPLKPLPGAKGPWPPHCDGCRDALKEPGALIFSPPNEHDECTKVHLCVRCFGAIAAQVLHLRMRNDIGRSLRRGG